MCTNVPACMFEAVRSPETGGKDSHVGAGNERADGAFN